MARKKNLSISEQIEVCNSEIHNAEEKLILLRSKLADLLEAKKQEDMLEIYNLIQACGLSVGQAKDLIGRDKEQNKDKKTSKK